MSEVINILNDLMANEYDALTWMDKPMPESYAFEQGFMRGIAVAKGGVI